MSGMAKNRSLQLHEAGGRRVAFPPEGALTGSAQLDSEGPSKGATVLAFCLGPGRRPISSPARGSVGPLARVLSFLLLVAAVMLSAGCSRPDSYGVVPSSALLAPTPEPRPQAIADAAAPEELVREAQGLLTELGYRPGPEDGILGPWTETAIRAFQETRGIEPDGRVTGGLIEELETVRKIVAVRNAQEQLARLGYDPGPADGDMGPRTQRAIAAFEADAGVTPRGRATPELLRLLARAAGPAPEEAAAAPAAAEASVRAAPVEAVAVETAAVGRTDGELPPAADVSVDPTVALSSSGAADRDAADGDAVARDETPDMRVESLLSGQAGSDAAAAADQDAADRDVAEDPTSVAPHTVALDAAERLAPAAGAPTAAETAETKGLPRAGHVTLVSEAASEGGPADGVTQVAHGAGETPAKPRIIAPGDRIRLQIVSDKIEVREFQVNDEGRIQLEDDVAVQAAGRTLHELEQAVMVQLVQVYLMSLEVNISHPADDRVR